MSDLRRLRTLTRRLHRLASDQEAAAAERRECVRTLLASGWSLAALAAELGVTKSAVQKMAS